jgi:hypothetical protein
MATYRNVFKRLPDYKVQRPEDSRLHIRSCQYMKSHPEIKYVASHWIFE